LVSVVWLVVFSAGASPAPAGAASGGAAAGAQAAITKLAEAKADKRINCLREMVRLFESVILFPPYVINFDLN
jgi:hypothetical protein